MPWNAPPIIRRRVHNITDRAGVITRAEHTSDQTITHYPPEWNPQDKSVNQFPVARIIPHRPSFLLPPSFFILTKVSQHNTRRASITIFDFERQTDQFIITGRDFS